MYRAILGSALFYSCLYYIVSTQITFVIVASQDDIWYHCTFPINDVQWRHYIGLAVFMVGDDNNCSSNRRVLCEYFDNCL